MERGQDQISGAVLTRHGELEPGGPATLKANDPPRLALETPADDWREERLLDEEGEEIFVRYKGEPKERYEFIRDYLDFKGEAHEMNEAAN
jgi:hypothetical protein